VAGVITAFAVACTSIATPGTEEAPSSSAVARTRRDRSAACALPPTVLRRIWRGTRSDASGDIQIVTAEPDYVGGGLSHAGPWDYVQRVPLFLYGPGRVPPSGRIERSATLADIAPTLAAMLGFDFEAPDGRVLESALAPTAGQDPPRLLVTLVWDGAGRNVLDHWTGRWPFLSGLIADGVWFERAEVGSSPSNTPPSHATIGTGAFPRRHGVVDLFQHVDGEIVKPQEAGPHTLLVPTLADLYDADRDNEPLVGVIGTLGTHTGMVGHGSGWPGGDADIAVMRELEDAVTGGAEADIWQLTTGMTPYFQMPPYVNEVPGMEPELDALDREDGVVDRAWGEHAFDALEDGFQTPARSPYQTRIVEEIVAREGFGVDDVPDLLFVNLKAADSVGHLFGVGSAEMGATVRWLDSALEDLVGLPGLARRTRRVGDDLDGRSRDAAPPEGIWGVGDRRCRPDPLHRRSIRAGCGETGRSPGSSDPHLGERATPCRERTLARRRRRVARQGDARRPLRGCPSGRRSSRTGLRGGVPDERSPRTRLPAERTVVTLAHYHSAAGRVVSAACPP
jgi:hypothetical protein